MGCIDRAFCGGWLPRGEWLEWARELMVSFQAEVISKRTFRWLGGELFDLGHSFQSICEAQSVLSLPTAAHPLLDLQCLATLYKTE